MADFTISNAAAIALCDALVDLVDAGAGPGVKEIRTSAPPADCEAADSGTLLGTLTMSDPAYGSAVDATPGATATASTITSDSSADTTGTAGHWREKDSNGVVVDQGDITATGGGGDLELDSVAIVGGGQINITSATKHMPESA